MLSQIQNKAGNSLIKKNENPPWAKIGPKKCYVRNIYHKYCGDFSISYNYNN